MRKDGDITVYVIKHVHPSTIKNGWDGKSWDNSGDGSQFEYRGRNCEIFDPFRASGDVWQQYGIHATFNEDEARSAVLEMERCYPEYHWGVFKVHLTKHTTPVLLLTK